MSGQHWLVVAPFDPADPEVLDVEHSDDCPRQDLGAPSEMGEAWDYACAVAYQLDEGIDYWFRHADDPTPQYDEAEPVATGRHEIEAWAHRHPSGPWGGGDWDAGLRLVVAS